LGGVLENTLETIRMLVKMDFWVEIVTLVIPGFNDGNDELKQIADFIGLPRRVSQRTLRLIESRLDISMEEVETDRVLAGLDIPLLVFHDEEDRDVPWEDGASIARAAKDANLVRTSGLGHRRIIRDPAVIRQAVDFMRAPRRASLPAEAV
ncbi:MAG: hypothetical protein IH798_05820, partial [Gemmatimonadetes bacterium]|nr:hypothetical protein [Gemmatimonadota bacterium]